MLNSYTKMTNKTRSLLSGIYIRFDDTPVSASYLCLNLVVIIIGICVVFLNSIAVVTILQKQKWRDLSCVFLMNLAMSDSLLGFAVTYNGLYNLLHLNFFHECVFRYSCINATIFTSVFMLLGLGFDRYLKIIFPFRYINICFVETVVIYVAIVWTCAVLMVVVPFATRFFAIHDDKSCGYFIVLDKRLLQAFALVMFIALAIQIFINVHLLLVASSKLCPSRIRDRQRNIQKIWQLRWTWWRPAKTVIIIVGVNVIFMVPAGIYLVIATSGALDADYDSFGKDELLTYIGAPIILNSLANPILYACKIKDIRQKYKKFFCCQGDDVFPVSKPGNSTFVTSFPLVNRLPIFSSRRRSSSVVTPFPVSTV